jgi:hypothetical protein
MNRSVIHWPGRLCLGLLILHILSSVSSAQDDPKLKDRFLREAPHGWKAYLTFSKGVSASWTAGRSGERNGKVVETARGRTEYKHSKNGAIRTRLSLEPGTDGDVVGVNSSYLFRLQRKSSWKGWVVLEVQAKGSPNWQTRENEIRDEVVRGASEGLRLYTLWLPDLLQDKNFQINSVRTHQQDGSALVRVDFEYLKAKETFAKKGMLPIRSGWMLLDPGHDWILREYDLMFLAVPPEYGTLHTTLAITEGTGRHSIVVRSNTTQQGRTGDDTSKTVSEAEAEAAERGDVPTEEFTLSAFGLPEPGTVVAESTWSYYLWFAGAGVLALLLGQFLRNRAKRRREA